jgi:hypothetical protein
MNLLKTGESSMKTPLLSKVALVVIASMVLHLCAPVLLMARILAEDVRVANVHVSVEQNRVRIAYDLNGLEGDAYTVSLKVKLRSNGETFYAARGLSGDAGKGVRTGRDKMIVWEMTQDLPQGMDVAEKGFEVQATQEAEEGGISTWVWIAGGAAVAAGAALLVFGKKSETTSSAATSGFPAEPQRPR